MTASKQDQEAKTITREMGSKVPVIIGIETVVLPVHQLHRDENVFYMLITHVYCLLNRRTAGGHV